MPKSPRSPRSPKTKVVYEFRGSLLDNRHRVVGESRKNNQGGKANVNAKAANDRLPEPKTSDSMIQNIKSQKHMEPVTPMTQSSGSKTPMTSSSKPTALLPNEQQLLHQQLKPTQQSMKPADATKNSSTKAVANLDNQKKQPDQKTSLSASENLKGPKTPKAKTQSKPNNEWSSLIEAKPDQGISTKTTSKKSQGYKNKQAPMPVSDWAIQPYISPMESFTPKASKKKSKKSNQVNDASSSPNVLVASNVPGPVYKAKPFEKIKPATAPVHSEPESAMSFKMSSKDDKAKNQQPPLRQTTSSKNGVVPQSSKTSSNPTWNKPSQDVRAASPNTQSSQKSSPTHFNNYVKEDWNHWNTTAWKNQPSFKPSSGQYGGNYSPVNYADQSVWNWYQPQQQAQQPTKAASNKPVSKPVKSASSQSKHAQPAAKQTGPNKAVMKNNNAFKKPNQSKRVHRRSLLPYIFYGSMHSLQKGATRAKRTGFAIKRTGKTYQVSVDPYNPLFPDYYDNERKNLLADQSKIALKNKTGSSEKNMNAAKGQSNKNQSPSKVTAAQKPVNNDPRTNKAAHSPLSVPTSQSSKMPSASQKAPVAPKDTPKQLSKSSPARQNYGQSTGFKPFWLEPFNPKPQMKSKPVTLPSKEAALDFRTVSPFDPEWNSLIRAAGPLVKMSSKAATSTMTPPSTSSSNRSKSPTLSNTNKTPNKKSGLSKSSKPTFDAVKTVPAVTSTKAVTPTTKVAGTPLKEPLMKNLSNKTSALKPFWLTPVNNPCESKRVILPSKEPAVDFRTVSPFDSEWNVLTKTQASKTGSMKAPQSKTESSIMKTVPAKKQAEATKTVKADSTKAVKPESTKNAMNKVQPVKSNVSTNGSKVHAQTAKPQMNYTDSKVSSHGLKPFWLTPVNTPSISKKVVLPSKEAPAEFRTVSPFDSEWNMLTKVPTLSHNQKLPQSASKNKAVSEGKMKNEGSMKPTIVDNKGKKLDKDVRGPNADASKPHNQPKANQSSSRPVAVDPSKPSTDASGNKNKNKKHAESKKEQIEPVSSQTSSSKQKDQVNNKNSNVKSVRPQTQPAYPPNSYAAAIMKGNNMTAGEMKKPAKTEQKLDHKPETQKLKTGDQKKASNKQNKEKSVEPKTADSSKQAPVKVSQSPRSGNGSPKNRKVQRLDSLPLSPPTIQYDPELTQGVAPFGTFPRMSPMHADYAAIPSPRHKQNQKGVKNYQPVVVQHFPQPVGGNFAWVRY